MLSEAEQAQIMNELLAYVKSVTPIDTGNMRYNAVQLKSLGGKKIAQPTKQDISKLLGKEYKGFKGQDAINKLLAEKQGHIKAAFTRSDIGDIDLLWGNDDIGLQHIIKSAY